MIIQGAIALISATGGIAGLLALVDLTDKNVRRAAPKVALSVACYGALLWIAA